MTISTVTGARIFDGERLTADIAVRFDQEGILAVGGPEVAQPGDVVIDAAGGTLLPGLVDAHVHLLPGAAHQAATFGITTIVDQFSKPPLVGHELGAAHTGAVADVHTSSIGATAPGGHPSMMYAPFPTVSDPGDAPGFVAARIGEGATHLKVLYESGEGTGWDIPSLDLATVEALVVAAHAAGLLVVAHVHRARDAVDIARTGVDVLAHVPIDPMTPDQVFAVASTGVAVIATLAAADGFPNPGATMALLARPDLAARLGPAWTSVIEAQARRWMPPMPSFAPATANVRALHEAGARVLSGTDAPNPGTVHGASLHRELELLVEAGLSPTQALAAATSLAADVLQLPRRGYIRPGQRADLLLVSGRPDQQITDTGAIQSVWANARVVTTGSYVGSDDEAAGLVFLQTQTDKVIAAAREAFGDFMPQA